MRWFIRRVLVTLVSLLFLVLLFAGWLVYTHGGAHAAAAIAPNVVPGDLSIGGVQGVLGDAVTVTGLQYTDSAAGIELTLERATVSFELSKLPRGRLHVREATVEGLVLGLKGGATDEKAAKPKSSPPFDVELERVTLRRGSVKIGTRVISIDQAQLAGSYKDGKLEITHFALGEGAESELPVLGLKLRDASVSVLLKEDETTFSGKVSSGDGVLQVDGSSATSVLHLSVQGRDVLAADIPGARVVASPQLKLDGPTSDLALTGTLEIPKASVDVSKVTRSGGHRASPDVVVVDREQKEAERGEALKADVLLVLGDDVKLVGFGLDAHVTGELRVSEQPGAATVASGELRLTGTYDAYGRKLTIERGKLQFASSSIDNPELDIIAVRRVQEVTARLHVSGTARRPLLNVSAEPAMSSTDALSYLVSGKPLDDLREEENTLADSAGKSLGGMVTDKIARRVASRFGIDSAGVEQNAELGSALTLGKYLSPRLFVSYGIGLFEPGHTMTLRYKFSEHWSVEADQAPEDQRAGLRYRVEK